MAEVPKKGDNGKVYGVFDILDTPNGRILKTLCDYGCNIGVSSRGGGDTYEDHNGEENVDPLTYEFECFDCVLLPAVMDARPKYVTESYDTHKKSLKVALREAFQNSSEEDQKVMKNTLENLELDYSEETDNDNNPERVDNIEVTSDSAAAEDDGASIITELHEALQRQQQLEFQVKSLQEKLSVCSTKESRYSDKLGKATLKATTQEAENKKLSEQLTLLTSENNKLMNERNALSEKVKSLTDEVNTNVQTVKDLTESLNGYRTRYSEMQNQLKTSKQNKTSLDESLSSKSAKVKELTEAYSKLMESSEKKLKEALDRNTSLEEKNRKLVEQIDESKKDSQIIKSQSTAKIEKAQQLVEKYKSIARTAVDKYINSQASRIGVSASEIKSRLNESYSFKDVDKAVEEAQQYKLDIHSLPFSTFSEKKPVKMQIRESKDSILNMKDNSSYNFDDDIDTTLLTFTN